MKRDIHGYKPAPGDLAYPDKLLVASNVDQASDPLHSDSDSVFDTSGNEVNLCNYSLITYVRVLHLTSYTFFQAISIGTLCLLDDGDDSDDVMMVM